jgi:tagatose 1,6-diphosphate aldolase GatY/KbaY
MSITNMRSMLIEARRGEYAVGAFNILDYNSMKAVVDAAEELSAPVIVQTSVKTVEFWGFTPLIDWYHSLAEKAHVPVAIHLDHCKEVAFIEQCLKHGWTSVMIDASALPFEENLQSTKRVVNLAGVTDATVEAELGAIVGVEDDIHVKEQDAHLADPQSVETFCNQVIVDCFAPAIGTAHGLYKGEPKIAFDLLETIFKKISIPFALHGGTGLSETVFKKCIQLGCAKINVSTQLKHAFIDGFTNYHTDHSQEYDPLKVIKSQYTQLKKDVMGFIGLFGSERKA